MFARHGFHVLDIFPLHKMFVLILPSNGEMKRDPKGLLFLLFFPSLFVHWHASSFSYQSLSL